MAVAAEELEFGGATPAERPLRPRAARQDARLAAVATPVGPVPARSTDVAAGSRAGVVSAARPARWGPAPCTGYRRRRFVAVVLIVTGVLALRLTAPGANVAASTPAAGPAATAASIVVAEGDTVWSLAMPHLPAGEAPHAYVARVLRLNQLDGNAAARLQAGTLLLIPAD